MKMEGPYWVYTHTCPNGMIYVGYSKQKYFNSRCRENQYSTTALQPYIEEFGWENIEHFFIDGIQTRESAMKLECDLIKMYSEMGCCININDSGSWSLDKKKYENNKEKIKEYNEKYREEHKEEIKEKKKKENKKYYENHKEKERQRQKKYREEHKEYKKEYYKEHKEQLKEYQKEYYKEHKEEIKEKMKNMDKKEYNKKYYQEHKKKRKAQQMAYYYRNREKRMQYQTEYDRRKRESRQSVTDNCDNVSEETDSDTMS